MDGFLGGDGLFVIERQLLFTYDAYWAHPEVEISSGQWFVNAIGRVVSDRKRDIFTFVAHDMLMRDIIGEYNTRARKGKFRLLDEAEKWVLGMLTHDAGHLLF